MATFSDYFNQKASAAPPPQRQTPSATPLDFSWMPKPGQTVENPEPQSPLNWAIDMLSRPLFGMTTAVGGYLEGAAKSREEGNPGAALGALAATPTNFLAGLFDTTGGEGTKRTYGDLMEQYTDRFGKLDNPDYVDTENNVDPILRGVGGFALDVVADPLTWIPGGAILKGAKIAGSAAKTGVEAAEAAVKAARGGEKVAEATKVSDKILDTSAGRVKNEADSLQVRPVDEPLDANPFGAEARAPREFSKPVEAAPISVVDDAVPLPKVDYVSWAKTVKTPEVQKALSAHEKLLAKGEAVTAKQLAASESKLAKLYSSISKAPATLEEAGDRTLAQLIGDSPKAPIVRQELQAVLDSVGTKTAPKLDKAWMAANRNVKVNDIPITLGSPPARFTTLFRDSPAEFLKGTKPLSIERAARIMSNQTVDEAARTYARKLIEHAHKSSVGASTSDVTDALVAFTMRKESNVAKMKDAVGEPLFNEISRKNTAKSMDTTIRKVLDALDPESNLERFYSANPRLGDALNDSLGIPRYVRPAANTVEEVAVTAEKVNDLTPVARAMAKVFREELPISANFNAKHVSRKGSVAFTDADTQLRTGNRYLELNSMTQQSLTKALWSEIDASVLKATGKNVSDMRGMPRNRAVEAAYEELSGELVAALQTFGVKLHIGIGEDLLPITFPEVYKIVGNAIPSDTMKQFVLYNGGTRVAVTPLLQAAHRAVMAGDDVAENVLRQEIADIISGKLKWGEKGARGEKLPNNIADNAKAAKFKTTSEKLVGTLADAIVASRGALAARIADNAEMWTKRGLNESAQLGQKELDKLKAVIGDDVYSESAEAIAGIGKSIADEGTSIGSLQSSVDAATDVTKAAVGDLSVKVAENSVKVEQAVSKGVSRSAAVSKGSQKTADDIYDELDELGNQKMPDTQKPSVAPVGVDESVPALDLASMKPDPVVAQQGFVGQILNGFRNTFDQTYGVDRLWNVAHSKRTNAGEYMGRVIEKLRELRKLPEDVQVAAIKAAQAGVPNTNPEVQAAVKLVDSILSPIFGGGRSLLDNKFLSVEKDLDHINDVLRMKGLPDDFRLGEDLNDWRSWDIKDPSRTLLRIADAAATVTEHRAIVGNFVSTMRAEKLLSDTPKPGMVRVTDTGGSTFARLIPEGVYVDRAMATQLHRLDVLTRTSRQFSGEVGKFINEYYMPVQSIWKQLITVFRPGHHLRNVAGNSFMSWIDRGNRHYLSSQKDAMKVLAVKNNYSDIDLITAMKSFGDEALPTGGDVVIRGRFGDMSTKEIYDIAERNGLFSTFASSEDLMLEAGKGKISRVGEAISNSKIGSVAGSVSHAIDHHAKLQHLIQILKQEAGGGRYARYGKATSKQKVIDRAISDIKRSHPDSMMLTPTESKFRFLIPFYTWFAKTLPFAMESAARNPGRVIAIPKASYSLAVASGVNPDSLVDPFPEDQLFPRYITEGVFGPQFVGPDGEYININPGVPQFDLLKDIGSDPIRGVAGMVSPLLRAPAELLSGGQWATGAPIKDTSDYIDQNLPIVNYIANMTGTSVTGSVPSLLSGQGLDPQRQVAAGNKGPLDTALTFSNWFSGANAQNWSRPNLVNYAEIEKRNRESGKTGGF